MILKVNDEIYDISKEDLINNHYLNEGDESVVYKFGEDVFKLYKSYCLKQRLSEKNISYLSHVDTSRLLMPKDKIYKDDKFNGYTMTYINSGSKDCIKSTKMKDIINELEILKQDLIKLKDSSVLIDDIHKDNYIFNGSMYFIDPGSYTISKKLSSRYIEILNREMMYDFFIDKIFLKPIGIAKSKREKLTRHIPIDEYMSDSLCYDIDPNETLMHYVKRIVK